MLNYSSIFWILQHEVLADFYFPVLVSRIGGASHRQMKKYLLSVLCDSAVKYNIFRTKSILNDDNIVRIFVKLLQSILGDHVGVFNADDTFAWENQFGFQGDGHACR